MIYITGDTHGEFGNVAHFCEQVQTEKSDILIILGDAGVNFHADSRDILRKEYLSKLPVIPSRKLVHCFSGAVV